MEATTGNAHRRVLSCEGVSFESNRFRPTAPPHTIAAQLGEGRVAGGRLVWVPWGRGNSILKAFHASSFVEKSFSRTSSHFCDIDDDEGDDDDRNLLRERSLMSIRIDEAKEDDVEQPKPIEVIKQQPSVIRMPKESRLSVILLDQGLLTVYKRLFAACFALNIIMLILAITGDFPYARERAALFAMGNILALTLCRSEAFLRVVFWLAVKVLGRPYVPLPVKTATTSLLQSVGGIHSSCGVSSVVWLIYALVRIHNTRQGTTSEIVAFASIILSLLCISCMAAFPLVRHLHHNVFERTHRFAGWTALAFLWVFVVLMTGYDSNTRSYDNLKGSKLVRRQEFWFTVAITFFTILPWVTVRRVPVDITAPSGHASIIKFAGGVQAGILGRISRSPLSEWHAFGIISNGKDGHMMLAGAVGDFTKGLVLDPPSHLWVRQVRFAGLPYLVNMYKRVVLVATGSGICVFLSFLLQPCAARVCVVWVTKGVEQNFGEEIKEMMSGHPPGKVIVHDTAVSGRPNVAEMTIKAANDWKAEVVVVTSNPQGSRDVVTACKDAGIAAFGPIWDS